jgi:hypothetical protein
MHPGQFMSVPDFENGNGLIRRLLVAVLGGQSGAGQAAGASTIRC